MRLIDAKLAGLRSRVNMTPMTSARHLLHQPDALLTRTPLRELGLERAIDAVFRALPIVSLPGYGRPLIRASDYIELIQRQSFDGDRVRPAA